MKLKPVQSTNLEAIGYDAHAKRLTIKFKAGSTYQYEQVPKSVHDGLMKAESHGQYFAEKIRPFYKYKKVGA